MLWVFGGSLFMYLIAIALAQEMAQFPGGADAFAASLRPGVEALRPMRWPADRLDTLGGYLTYHNVTLYTLFLSIYAAVQGSRAVRGAEEHHALEGMLATGWSRAAVVRDRALGFLLATGLISGGLGLGIAVSMYAGGEPDLVGSLIVMAASGLAAMAGYGLGMLVSQLTASARTASGISVLVLTVLYVGTNVWDQIGALGVLRFVSPFYYANASRALVPGLGADPLAMATLAMMALATLGLAALAFQHRDYGAALWHRRPAAEVRAAAPRVQRPALRSLWSASLLRERVGVAVWAISAAAFSSLMVVLEPTVMDAWDAFKDYIGGGVSTAAASPQEQYLAFAGDVITPVVAAYVITQAAAWVADLEQGRVEVVLAAPVSWTRLVWERIAAVLFGTAVITVAGITALAVGASRIGLGLSAEGLGRLAVGCLLLGGAIGGVAAVVVAVARSGPAIPVLAVFLGTSYLLGLMAPLLEWPEWVGRLSVFTALGHPYLEWPSAEGALLLLGMFLPGVLLACAIAERTPKVAHG